MNQFHARMLDPTNQRCYPGVYTHTKRKKEVGLDLSNLKPFASTSSISSHKTHFIHHFNSITAGHYPVCVNDHRNLKTVNDKRLIQVTVYPKSPLTAHKRRNRPSKRTAFANLTHSISDNSIYLLVPGVTRKKNDKVYAIYTTQLNDKIIKEVNFNNLLTKCILRSNIIREMNKNKKKNSDKEKREKSYPQCSPDCAYKKNIVDIDKSGSESARSSTRFDGKKTKSSSESPLSPARSIDKKKYADSDKSGSESPRSATRSKYKVVESNTSISLKHGVSGKRTSRSPDKSRLKDIKTNSPTSSNRQQLNTSYHQTESNKKGPIKSPDMYSFIDDARSIESLIAETKRRSPERYNERIPSPERPGRIRITGRLGLTKDDKCVLKCDATLDDKPIPTQFIGAACVQQPCIATCTEDCRSSVKQRNAKLQAGNKVKGSGVPLTSYTAIGKESQATQVDFQIFHSKNSSINVTQRCACVNTAILGGDEGTDKALKKNNNPVIIISVYPKTDVTAEVSGDLKKRETITTMQKKESKKNGHSRSPSPAKTTKKTNNKKSETHISTTSSKKVIRESTRKDVKSTRDNRSRSRERSPTKNIVQSNSVSKSKTDTKTSKSKAPKFQKTPPRSRLSKSPKNPAETKVTEQMIKKALIEDFTKNYTEQVTQRNTRLDIPLHTKHNVSNITIDIEGDSDYYNVRFAQGTGKTEFTVRKPSEKEPVTSSVTEENEATSLENFLYVKPDDEPRKRSFSQTLMFDGIDMIRDKEAGLELEVKDSIEISHRRGHGSKSNLHREDETNYPPKDVDTEFIAQMKHYQGDECSVSDRHERDKEIRKLLGIDKIVETDFAHRKSKTTCSRTPNDAVAPLYLCICDRFSGTSQTNNSVLASQKTSSIDIENSSIHIVHNVFLDQPTHQMIQYKDIPLNYRQNNHKYKPIILTRRQYVNVKKTIYNTLILKHNPLFRAKWYNPQRRSSTDTDVPKRKEVILHYDKDTQTEQVKHANIQTHARNQAIDVRPDVYDIKEINNCGDGNSKRAEECKSSSIKSQETFGHPHPVHAKWTQQAMKVDKYMHDVQRTVILCEMPNQPLKRCLKEHACRNSVSLKEIQCQTVAVTSVKFSSSDTADCRSGRNTVEIKDSTSIHTIFKNRRKPVTRTPNLGTSAYSLCESSEYLKSGSKILEDSINHDVTSKKPFLKRIMSCLVFSVFPTTRQGPSQLKTHGPISSLDSYHFGSSFGAIEMDSSLYDTTASFYSDHAIHSSVRTKRRFFDNIRVFFSRK